MASTFTETLLTVWLTDVFISSDKVLEVSQKGLGDDFLIHFAKSLVLMSHFLDFLTSFGCVSVLPASL